MSTIAPHRETVDILVTDDAPPDVALKRTTHLGIGAHPDDLEIMAFHGILHCFRAPNRWFTGVTCTHGGDSPRAGPYAACSGIRMQRMRREEQRTAARVGDYSAVVQLGYPDADFDNRYQVQLQDDLVRILRETKPETVYTHNPADGHPAHVAVASATVDAIRTLSRVHRPQHAYGCEVWRSLDWLPDKHKAVLDVSHGRSLAAALLGVYDSQIRGGKRYDRATIGRRHANATYLRRDRPDTMASATFAMDLTPLLHDDNLTLAAYVERLIQAFHSEVMQPLRAAAER
jgi:LmbE family N-acetylglucosaminyl deacetylase